MKKLILIVIGVLMMFISSYAQDEKLSIGVSVGTGIPIGHWGQKGSVDNEFNGYANSGLAYDLSISYKLGQSNFGLTTLIRRQNNTVDTEAMADAFRIQNTSSSYTVDSDRWITNEFLLGGFGTKSISNKLDVDFKVLVGIIDIGRPLFTIFADEVNFIAQNSDSSVSLAYLFGTSIKYQITNKLDFLVNVDYLGSKPKFNVEETSNIGYEGNTNFFQVISSINLSAGIAIKL